MSDDNEIKTYWFGDDDSETWDTRARSIDVAVRMFRAAVLYPEEYVRKEDILEKEYRSGLSEHNRERRSGYEITVKDGAQIEVRVGKSGCYYRDAELVTTILWDDPNDLGFRPDYSRAALPGEVADMSDASALVKLETDIQAESRHQLRKRMDQLAEVRRQLEIQKRELMAQADVLRLELNTRLKQIWRIELYAGSEEVVVQLREGNNSPEGVPLQIRQGLLYMDEEYAITEWNKTGDVDQFDYENVEDFDNWLLADERNLNSVIPEEKGMVAIRIRRHDKEYGEPKDISEALRNAQKNEWNRNTYFLIRNGGNLYRIWADIVIWPRLFPRATELEEIGSKTYFGKDSDEVVKDQFEHYFSGLLVLQGLIDRSAILQPMPEGVDVLRGVGMEGNVELIRDDEVNQLPEDIDIPDWHTYKESLSEAVQVGSRVLVMADFEPLHPDSGYKSRFLRWYQNPPPPPSQGELYVIETELEKREGRWGPSWTIKYLPDQVVYDSSWGSTDWEGHQRTRRESIKLYKSEVIDFDAINPDMIDRIINERQYRRHYARTFRPMMRAAHFKREEEKLEEPLITMVIHNLGLDPHDEALRVQAREVVRWWKMKTKLRRAVSEDDAKALRMVTKELKSRLESQPKPQAKSRRKVVARPGKNG